MLVRTRELSPIALLGTVGLLLGGAGCSSSKHGASSTRITQAPSGSTTTGPAGSVTTAPPATTSTTQPLNITSTHALNTPADVTNGTLEVLSYESPATPASASTKPPAGRQFALISVKSCAGPSAARSAAPADFRLQLADGGVATPRVSIKDPAFVVEQLKPSACETGYVTFAIPVGSKGAVVVDTGSGAAWKLS